MTEPVLTTHIVVLWCRLLFRVNRKKKVAFVYLANDLIQKTLIQMQQKKAGSGEQAPEEEMNFVRGYEKVIAPVLTKLF